MTAATLVSIGVTPATPSKAKGLTQQLTATGVYTDNSTQDLTTTVTWSSSDTNRVTISNADGSRGLASTPGVGAVTVTATSAPISAAAVTVKVVVPLGAGGVTSIETSPAFVTVTSVDPVTAPSAAEMVAGPTATVVTRPEALTVAPGADELQVTCVERSWVVLSVNVPVATSWVVSPFATLGAGGRQIQGDERCCRHGDVSPVP